MTNKKKEIIQKIIKSQRVFNYSNSVPLVSLSFTLSTENSSELRAFLSLLQEATKDVEQAISEMKN